MAWTSNCAPGEMIKLFFCEPTRNKSCCCRFSLEFHAIIGTVTFWRRPCRPTLYFFFHIYMQLWLLPLWFIWRSFCGRTFSPWVVYCENEFAISLLCHGLICYLLCMEARWWSFEHFCNNLFPNLNSTLKWVVISSGTRVLWRTVSGNGGVWFFWVWLVTCWWERHVGRRCRFYCYLLGIGGRWNVVIASLFTRILSRSTTFLLKFPGLNLNLIWRQIQTSIKSRAKYLEIGRTAAENSQLWPESVACLSIKQNTCRSWLVTDSRHV